MNTPRYILRCLLVVAIALGYGRRESERFARVGPEWLEGGPTVGDDGRVGKNAAPLLELREGLIRYAGVAATATKTGRRYALASTQDFHLLLGADFPAQHLPDRTVRGRLSKDTPASSVGTAERSPIGGEPPLSQLKPHDCPASSRPRHLLFIWRTS